MIMIIINRMTSVRIQTTSTNYSEHYYEIPKFKESIMRSTIRPTFTSFCSNISKEHMFCFAKCDHKTIVQKNMTTKHSKYVPDHFFVRFVVRFFNKTEYIFGFFFHSVHFFCVFVCFFGHVCVFSGYMCVFVIFGVFRLFLYCIYFGKLSKCQMFRQKEVYSR